MSPAVLTPPGPRQMAADELLGHRRDLLADVDDQALNDWRREHLSARVTVHTGCSPQKQDICRYERARCRRLDAGPQCRLSVLRSPPCRKWSASSFRHQNWLEAGFCIRMLMALAIDAGPCGACLHIGASLMRRPFPVPPGNSRILKYPEAGGLPFTDAAISLTDSQSGRKTRQ